MKTPSVTISILSRTSLYTIDKIRTDPAKNIDFSDKFWKMFSIVKKGAVLLYKQYILLYILSFSGYSSISLCNIFHTDTNTKSNRFSKLLTFFLSKLSNHLCEMCTLYNKKKIGDKARDYIKEEKVSLQSPNLSRNFSTYVLADWDLAPIAMALQS